ncbi:adenylate kinase [Candidatus Marinamargulisbacteria bacterium SCGC AG-410-N11]|nr:adenylate kinase [Candidatus Marinamargulisbacteria bacterium SCGC AG-410-N11]
MNDRLLIFIGPPGSGKGTQSKLLCKNKEMLSISTGDILRKEVTDETNIGKRVSSKMKNGQLVSDDLINELFYKHFELEYKKNKYGIIADGYPRTLNQAKYLDSLSKDFGIDIRVCVFLCKEEVLVKRLQLRKRQDDEIAIIIKRLKDYYNFIAPVIKYYGNKINEVDVNDDPENIYNRIISFLN